MGRSKGIVEGHLDASEVAELAKCITDSMPAEHKGVVSVDATKLFGAFSINSALLRLILFCNHFAADVFTHDMSYMHGMEIAPKGQTKPF